MKRGFKHSAWVGSATVLVGGLLAGCGTGSTSGNTTSPSANQPVDFSKATGNIVWAAPPITHTGLRKALIAAFEKQYPKIHVTLQQQNSDTDTDKASLTTAINGGSATPDVYMGDVVWPAQFANSQLAMSLSGKLPSSFWSRFSSGLVKGATYNGNVYAAPFFADTAFLFYRKDLLQKAGLPVPTTWQQVMDDSKTLVQKGLVKNGFVWQGDSYEGLTCDFDEYLADAGGSVLSSDGKSSTINSPQGQKALSFMQQLISSGASPKATDTFQENDSMNIFNNGDAAFLRNWTYAWSNSQTPGQSKVVGKVGVVPLPSFDGPDGYSTVGGWNLYVNPHTKNVAADLAFINWMTGPDAQKILVNFGEIPTNASVANAPATKAKNPAFGLLGKIKYVSRPVQNPNYPQISQAIYSNVNQALSSGGSAANALKQADSQISSALGSKGL